MKETFATPAVGAIIRRNINNEPHILIQTRNKANDCGTNGLLEIPAGKVREYEKSLLSLATGSSGRNRPTPYKNTRRGALFLLLYQQKSNDLRPALLHQSKS